MPFNIWCGGCSSMIAKGVRFNAEKKQVGNYYSTKVSCLHYVYSMPWLSNFEFAWLANCNTCLICSVKVNVFHLSSDMELYHEVCMLQA